MLEHQVLPEEAAARESLVACVAGGASLGEGIAHIAAVSLDTDCTYLVLDGVTVTEVRAMSVWSEKKAVVWNVVGKIGGIHRGVGASRDGAVLRKGTYRHAANWRGGVE
jgi:hypothetical protein